MNSEPQCHLVRRWISQLEDQELPSERVQILESHLDRCSDCREWYEEFQRGMDALGLGVDKVSGELDQLLMGTLDPGKLSPPVESEETARAADRAAPRLAALAAGVLVMISFVAWGVFSGFSFDAPWRDVSASGQLSLTSLEGELRIDVDDEEFVVEQDGDAQMVEIGRTVRCRSGVGKIVDRDGRTITISAGSWIVLTANTSVTLIDGSATFHVPRHKGGLVVITDEVTTNVLGTTFVVQRWALRQRSEVRVTEGSVSVVRGERIPLPLRAGERVEVTSNGLMFHAVRNEAEGQAPLPRASLGGALENRSVEGGGVLPADESGGGARREQRREGRLPLDVPVQQRQGADPDGED